MYNMHRLEDLNKYHRLCYLRPLGYLTITSIINSANNYMIYVCMVVCIYVCDVICVHLYMYVCLYVCMYVFVYSMYVYDVI